MLIRLSVMDNPTVRTLVSMEIGGVKEVFVYGTKKVVDIQDRYVLCADTSGFQEPSRIPFAEFDVFTIYERRRQGNGKIFKISYLLRQGFQFLSIDAGVEAVAKEAEIDLSLVDFFDILMENIRIRKSFRVEVIPGHRPCVKAIARNGDGGVSPWPDQSLEDMFEEGNDTLETVFELQNRRSFPWVGHDVVAHKAIRRLFYETNLGRFLSRWADDGGPLRPLEP